MLLFVQFVQVSRAMTTYENMFGIDHHSAASLTSAFTSTGAALDPSLHPPSGSDGSASGAAAGGHGHRHGHGQGWLKQWSKLLGVDAFIETAAGRGAATAGSKAGKRKRGSGGNPYSRGCLTNCKDFWCDPSPVFGQRTETGAAVLGGRPVNYMEMYESPSLMEVQQQSRRLGRSGGGQQYEAVAGEEV